jgi:hypothetical protein
MRLRLACAAHLGFGWFFAGGNRSVDRAENDTGFNLLGIADDAGFVNVFAGEADICGGGWTNIVLLGNDVRTLLDDDANWEVELARKLMIEFVGGEASQQLRDQFAA